MEKKFKINRSNILQKILLDNGWIEGSEEDLLDFSYWDTFYTKGKQQVNSKIKTIDKKITNVIDNKKTMYTTLLINNLTYFLPKTYTDLENINPNIFTEDKIFFLKQHLCNGGKNVYAINSFERMNEIINKEYSKYILQEEVPDMLLIDGYKSSLRIYVLITNSDNYIYKEGRLYIYSKKYCKNNMSNNIHNDVYNSKFYSFSEQEYYNISYMRIKNICSKMLDCFFEKNRMEHDKFIILGLDFILNKHFIPYLIEVNAYPNLEPCCEIINKQNTKMMKDFFHLYINSRIEGKELNNTDIKWEDITVDISNYKKNTVDVYKNIRKPIGINLIIEQLNAKFKGKKDIKILDCGCGCGNYSVELYNNGFHNILAIDNNENMLNKLNIINPNIKTLKVDITKKIPLPSNEFNVIIINQVLHHLNDFKDDYINHKNLFQELNRLIKPNGLLSINTSSLEQHVFGMWWGEFIVDNLNKYCKRYCPEKDLIKILEKSNFVLKDKIICSEPFIGNNYYDMNYIFNDEITESDTLWKYVSNNEYNNLKLKLKSLDNLNEFFNEKLINLKTIGQSSFFFMVKKEMLN